MTRKLTDYLVLLGIAVVCTFLATQLAFVRGAFAQDIKTAQGVFCDTQEQAELFLSLFHKGDNPAETAHKVNTQLNEKAACGVLIVAFVKGDEVKLVRASAGVARIVKVLVVGIRAEGQWVRGAPFEQFTLYEVKEEEA